MKKLLFVLSLFLLITSCDKTPIITLSVDKPEITADGKEMATFKVISIDKRNNEEDVTNNSQIFFADSKLEVGSTTFSTTEPNSYSFYATYEDAVSNEVSITAIEVEEEPETPENPETPEEPETPEDPENPEQPENPEEPQEPETPENPQDTLVPSPIILSASKTTILNDGKDKVVFTVMQDSLEITNETKIYVGETKLRLNVFTSKTAGTYIAYAMKGEVKSNEITITVEDENGNEEPENPETPEEPEEPENPEQPSDPEVPQEPETPIELIASTTNIMANGSDAVTFTVMQENNDVTSQASIYVDGGKLNGNKFTTYTAGTYTAYAQKNEARSNEITITVDAVQDMGKTVVFAEGVSVSSGWYDVNKLKNGGGDINMCWAASASNIIQWWQDRYVEAGNTLPAGAVTGPGTKVYPEGYKYNLALMELYRDLWWNGKGGDTDHGVIWYFEGRNVQKYASEGSHAQPNDNTSGGYYSSIWNQILPKVYHEYKSDIFPNEFYNLISKEYNNYSNWGNGSGVSGIQQLKKFSDLVVEFIDRGVISFVISLNSNGGLLHATTLWGYEIDNATGMITKLWITDSDDMHQSGSGDPTQQKLQEYSVSFDGSKVKLSGAPYGQCWAMSLLPVSGYGSGL